METGIFLRHNVRFMKLDSKTGGKNACGLLAGGAARRAAPAAMCPRAEGVGAGLPLRGRGGRPIPATLPESCCR